MDFFGFLKSSFIFLSLVGIAIWIGMIWQADSEEELVQACTPIDWTMNTLHTAVAGLTGNEPTWTRKTQWHLVQGCYHLVWRFMQSSEHSEPDTRPAEGGVRTH